MVINCNTKVRSIPDKGKRMYCFEVICGVTKKPFDMSSDDEKSKHEWILVINKVCIIVNGQSEAHIWIT